MFVTIRVVLFCILFLTSSSACIFFFFFFLEPLENIATLLFLFVVTCLPKLAYDTNLVALVRRKGSDGIDGGPLIAGVVTILKQFHPCQTLKFFGTSVSFFFGYFQCLKF